MALQYIVREHEYLVEADTPEEGERLLIENESLVIQQQLGERRTLQATHITDPELVSDELLDQEVFNAGGQTGRQKLNL